MRSAFWKSQFTDTRFGYTQIHRPGVNSFRSILKPLGLMQL